MSLYNDVINPALGTPEVSEFQVYTLDTFVKLQIFHGLGDI